MTLKTILIGLISIIVIVSGIIIFINKDSKNNFEDNTKEPAEETIAKPWIEVLNPSVFEIKNDSELQELQTGDEIEQGTTIKTNEIGLANIYLPDGSVIRIDSETEFILEEGFFDSKNEKLVVRIMLASGRLWSKIFELSTPDSLWEVKTANTVATVRGTAFGIEYADGKTGVIGSENEVTVSAIDPQTKKIIEKSKVVITPNNFIEIKNEDIKEIQKSEKSLTAAVKVVRKEILEREWIKRAKEADIQFNKKINELRVKKLPQEELRKSIQETREQIKTKILEKEPISKIPPKTNDAKIIKPVSNSIASPAIKPATEFVKPEKLILETSNNLSQIKEGDKIYFKAILIMSNGEKKDVTNIVNWQVIGSVGSIEQPGVFMPKLDISIAELGQSFGTVIATWKDEKNDQGLLGSSPTLNIKAKIEETLDRRG